LRSYTFLRCWNKTNRVNLHHQWSWWHWSWNLCSVDWWHPRKKCDSDAKHLGWHSNHHG